MSQNNPGSGVGSGSSFNQTRTPLKETISTSRSPSPGPHFSRYDRSSPMHMGEETARVIPTERGEVIPITEDFHKVRLADPTINMKLTRDELRARTRFAAFLPPEKEQQDVEPKESQPVTRGVKLNPVPAPAPAPAPALFEVAPVPSPQPMITALPPTTATPVSTPMYAYRRSIWTRANLLVIVLILTVLMALFSFISYFGPWSYSKRTEVGSSGIVSWSYKWRYDYYLTYYTSETSSNEVLYRTASDWRRECHHDGTWASILFLTLGLALCIISFICVLYDKVNTSTPARRAAMVTLWTTFVFFFFSLGFWLLGCHDSVKVHTTKTRSTDPSQITNKIEVFWGWGLVLMCWLISLAASIFQTMHWRMGRVLTYTLTTAPTAQSPPQLELQKSTYMQQYSHPAGMGRQYGGYNQDQYPKSQEVAAQMPYPQLQNHQYQQQPQTNVPQIQHIHHPRPQHQIPNLHAEQQSAVMGANPGLYQQQQHQQQPQVQPLPPVRVHSLQPQPVLGHSQRLQNLFEAQAHAQAQAQAQIKAEAQAMAQAQAQEHAQAQAAILAQLRANPQGQANPAISSAPVAAAAASAAGAQPRPDMSGNVL